MWLNYSLHIVGNEIKYEEPAQDSIFVSRYAQSALLRVEEGLVS